MVGRGCIDVGDAVTLLCGGVGGGIGGGDGVLLINNYFVI